MDLISRLNEGVCQQGVEISVPSVSVNTERKKSVLPLSPASHLQPEALQALQSSTGSPDMQGKFTEPGSSHKKIFTYR